MKKMLLITDKNPMSGMFQLAKDIEGDIHSLRFNNPLYRIFPFLDKFNFDGYDEVITFLYPLHIFGKEAKKQGLRWVCYDNGTPPATETYFPNFWRRQYMKIFNRLNAQSMQGADEYWDVTEREQKPRWIKKSNDYEELKSYKPYALYLGRKTDYKNFDWLQKTMKELNIHLQFSNKQHSDEFIHALLSNAKMLVTASLWEGYGRPIMEACALNIPVVCYNVGAHEVNMKKYNNKGICVPLDINNMKKSEEDFKNAVIKKGDNHFK